MVRIINDSNWTATNFNSLLKYFCGYWETTKNFLSNILNSKIIANKNFAEYGMSSNYCSVITIGLIVYK